MSVFQRHTKRWREARVKAITIVMQDITGRLDRMNPSDPLYAALYAKRAELFWKRNAYYAKLHKETT